MSKWLFICLGLFTIATNSRSQSADSLNSPEDKMAEFPGGIEAMYKFINEHLTYPIQAIENNISGKVIVEFVVKKDGQVTEIKTLGPLIGFGLEEAAMNVVKAMPPWNPAIQKGKPVTVRFKLPINFSLPEVPDKKRKKQKSTHPPPPPPPEMRKELKRNPND